MHDNPISFTTDYFYDGVISHSFLELGEHWCFNLKGCLNNFGRILKDSHRISNLEIKNKIITCSIELLDTQSGKLVEKFIDKGFQIYSYVRMHENQLKSYLTIKNIKNGNNIRTN
jgi:hypothetical protein